MLGVSFGVLGGIGRPLWSHWGAYENVKKPLVFVMCSAFGSSWGAPSGVVFSFFRFPIVCTTVFFGCRSFFRFFRSYLRPFFGFRSFFCFLFFSGDVFSTGVFTGAIRLHAAWSSAGLSGNQRESAAPWIGSELRSYLKGNTRY